MEEGPEGERKVRPHGFPHVAEEEPLLQETGQSLSPAARKLNQNGGISSIKVIFLVFLSQVTEIQRVLSLHKVLLTLDYTSEDNKELVDLLLQCFHRPGFIKNDDVSQRFFSFGQCGPVSLTVCAFCRRGSASWSSFSAGTSTSSG